jgi:hypothetical protein
VARALGLRDLGERGHVDDAAAALLDHMPRRCLSDVKHAAQGDRNDAVPSLGIGIQEIEPVTDPGRFEHDIEPAEFAHDRGNGRIDRHAVAYVESRRGLRGERGHCSMARVPTIAEEDVKRPNRERECLVGERESGKQ